MKPKLPENHHELIELLSVLEIAVGKDKALDELKYVFRVEMEQYLDKLYDENAKQQIASLILEVRKIGIPNGPMHSIWDVLFDAESYVKGTQGIIEDPIVIIKYLQDYINARRS